MTTALEAAIVRLWKTDKRVVGAGVLVTDTLVLTCAHVVARALGIPDDTPEMPADELVLDFPLAAPGTWVTAQVSQWRPVQPDDSGDLACLELQGSPPQDAFPVPLMTATDLWGHPFRAFGFPAGHDNGVWASGILRAKQADGWIQIEDVKQTGYFIEPGFSGTPVWDETLNGVVGITVTAERQREVRAAFVIPVPYIVDRFPDLAPVVREQPLNTEGDGGKKQTSTKNVSRDYFEYVEGDAYTGPVTIYQPGSAPPPTEDPTPLREAYLNHLFETCGQVFLVGIDRKAAGQKTEACLKLSGIYTALLTLSAKHPEREFPSREGAGGGQERRSSAVDQLNQHKRLVILGDPGSGKSTFVNFVTLCLAGELLGAQASLPAHSEISDFAVKSRFDTPNLALLTAPLPNDEGEDEDIPQPWGHGPLLPVRIILRDFAAEGLPAADKQAKAIHLWEFLVKTLRETPFGDYAPFLQQHYIGTRWPGLAGWVR